MKKVKGRESKGNKDNKGGQRGWRAARLKVMRLKIMKLKVVENLKNRLWNSLVLKPTVVFIFYIYRLWDSFAL